MWVSCSFRLVMNKATNKPKGTAFVEFKDPAGAAKAAKASADARCVSEGCHNVIYHLVSQSDHGAVPCTYRGSCCKSPCTRPHACTAGGGPREQLRLSELCLAAACRLFHADLP